MTPEILDERLEQFAIDVLRTTAPLLRRIETRDMTLQLRRAATSATVNYGAACAGRSHADFTSKIGVAFEEADESRRWMRLLTKSELCTNPQMTTLLDEAVQLRAILSASHRTAKRNRDQRKSG